MRTDFRTGGNIDPCGKSGVFFAAHPDDWGLYFDRVVELLHRYQNCAVYFYNDGELSAGA